MTVRVPLRRGTAVLLAAVVFLFSAVAGLAVGVMAGQHHHPAIQSGVRVMGVDVGGLTRGQAESRLAAYGTELVGRPVLLHYGPHTWQLQPLEIGIEPAISRMVERAYSVGRSGGWTRGVAEQLQALWQGIDIPLAVTGDRETVGSSVIATAAAIERAPADATFRIQGGQVLIDPEIEGISIAVDRAVNDIFAAAAARHHRNVVLPVRPVGAEVTAADLRGLHIQQEVARFSTTFDAGEASRAHNIKLAATALDGTILQPDQGFSFNQAVGPRNKTAGYQVAPVIMDGQFVPGVGGGVCQVSSTLYNTVLLAGLAVEQRVPHSLPPGYVPPGRDATVAYGQIDFQFRNTGDAAVLVHAVVQGERLTVSLYGSHYPSSPVAREGAVVAASAGARR